MCWHTGRRHQCSFSRQHCLNNATQSTSDTLVVQHNLIHCRWEMCCNLELVNLKLIPRVYILSNSCEIALRWMPWDLTDDQSTGNGYVPSCNKPLPEPSWLRPMSPHGHNEFDHASVDSVQSWSLCLLMPCPPTASFTDHMMMSINLADNSHHDTHWVKILGPDSIPWW